MTFTARIAEDTRLGAENTFIATWNGPHQDIQTEAVVRAAHAGFGTSCGFVDYRMRYLDLDEVPAYIVAMEALGVKVIGPGKWG